MSHAPRRSPIVFPVLTLVLCLGWSASAGADELVLANGTHVPYTELIVANDAPMAFATIKIDNKVTSYRFSDVNLTSLPDNLRTAFTAYQHDQLQKRLIIKDDKWIHRDEMLLNADPRYLAKGKLAKVGPSILTFTNTTDRTVTIAVREGGNGYEMHVEAGKKKGYQVPNGTVTTIMAQESDDGKQLVIQKGKPMDLKNINMSVTIVKTDAIPAGEMGSIDIPEQYQVH